MNNVSSDKLKFAVLAFLRDRNKTAMRIDLLNYGFGVNVYRLKRMLRRLSSEHLIRGSLKGNHDIEITDAGLDALDDYEAQQAEASQLLAEEKAEEKRNHLYKCANELVKIIAGAVIAAAVTALLSKLF